MQLMPLQFQPGIVRDATARAAKGAWYDGNLVRFRMGFPESMGGWQKLTIQTFLGSCRALHVWFNLNGDRRLAVGTHRKYYLEFGQGLYDITPIRRSVTLNGPFAVTAGSTTMTVTDVAHGAVVGAFVTFSGAVSLGGDITATILNQEFEITNVVDADTYEVQLPIPAVAGDVTGTGGAAVVAAYQANPGIDTQAGGSGWGTGPWGVGGWGLPSSFSVDANLRIWAQDNFGEDLVYNVRNGGVFYWESALGLTVRGVRLADRAGADSETPTVATQMLVSDRDRHVIAFGSNFGGTTPQDPMLIRFSNQEDPLTWIPTATNTAGDIRLGSGSRILRALETKREILVWTDASLYSMRFIGPPFTFGVEQISTTTTAVGFSCFVAAEDAVYWMGRGTFWVYNGQVQELPCAVREYVFNDINLGQSDKIYAGVNSEFSEVLWFYPSKDSDENDRYVVFNYKEQVWYYGELARTAWIDCCPEPYPVAAGLDQSLYYHDFGLNDGSQTPNTPLNSFIESAPIDMQEGNQFMFVRRILPDLTFYNSNNSPQATLTLTTQNFSGSALGDTATAPTARSAVIPVEQFTEQVHVRLRGRSVRLRVESNKVDTRWQLGVPRIDVRPDGRR